MYLCVNKKIDKDINDCYRQMQSEDIQQDQTLSKDSDIIFQHFFHE